MMAEGAITTIKTRTRMLARTTGADVVGGSGKVSFPAGGLAPRTRTFKTKGAESIARTRSIKETKVRMAGEWPADSLSHETEQSAKMAKQQPSQQLQSQSRNRPKIARNRTA